MATFHIKIRQVDPGAKVSEDLFFNRTTANSITRLSGNTKLQGILKLSEADTLRVIKYARALVTGAATVDATALTNSNAVVDGFVG